MQSFRLHPNTCHLPADKFPQLEYSFCFACTFGGKEGDQIKAHFSFTEYCSLSNRGRGMAESHTNNELPKISMSMRLSIHIYETRLRMPTNTDKLRSVPG